MFKIVNAILFLKEVFGLVKSLLINIRKKRQKRITQKVENAIKERDARKLSDELRKL